MRGWLWNYEEDWAWPWAALELLLLVVAEGLRFSISE